MTTDNALYDKYARLPEEVYDRFFGGMPIEGGAPKIRPDHPKAFRACEAGCGVKLSYRPGLDDVYEGFSAPVWCMECGMERFLRIGAQ